MRLLNVNTLELTEHDPSNTDYAILSHTWGKDEISFQQITSPSHDTIKGHQGYRKIIRFCEVAQSEGYSYAWVDTCCINKDSSAELSEAINSMYFWYETAKACFVYLADVSLRGAPTAFSGNFKESRWFTRGWTLQELVAPREVIFLSADWEEIGTKISLCESIEKITRINAKVLLDPGEKDKFSISTRMSWAAGRETTRHEDQAYCLMGLFGIYMPLLYGEQSQAFHRLQLEILKQSEDTTILSWGSPTEYNFFDNNIAQPGALAATPWEFPTTSIGCVSNQFVDQFRSQSTESTSEIPGIVPGKEYNLAPTPAIRLQVVKDFVRATVWTSGPFPPSTLKWILAASGLRYGHGTENTMRNWVDTIFQEPGWNTPLESVILVLVGCCATSGDGIGILLSPGPNHAWGRVSLDAMPVIRLPTGLTSLVEFHERTLYIQTQAPWKRYKSGLTPWRQHLRGAPRVPFLMIKQRVCRTTGFNWTQYPGSGSHIVPSQYGWELAHPFRDNYALTNGTHSVGLSILWTDAAQFKVGIAVSSEGLVGLMNAEWLPLCDNSITARVDDCLVNVRVLDMENDADTREISLLFYLGRNLTWASIKSAD